MAKISGSVSVLKNFSGSSTVAAIIPSPKTKTVVNVGDTHYIVLWSNPERLSLASDNDRSYSGRVYTFTDVTYYLSSIFPFLNTINLMVFISTIESHLISSN